MSKDPLGMLRAAFEHDAHSRRWEHGLERARASQPRAAIWSTPRAVTVEDVKQHVSPAIWGSATTRTIENVIAYISARYAPASSPKEIEALARLVGSHLRDVVWRHPSPVEALGPGTRSRS